MFRVQSEIQAMSEMAVVTSRGTESSRRPLRMLRAAQPDVFKMDGLDGAKTNKIGISSQICVILTIVPYKAIENYI